MFIALLLSAFLYREPETAIIITPTTDFGTEVFCGHFERIDDTSWRTESGADLAADTFDDNDDEVVEKLIHIPAGADVTSEGAEDLFFTLEDVCPHFEPTG